MTEYTKGPWRVGYGERHDHDECDIRICGDIFILAKIEGPNYSHCEANARMIAAAPDMYEALKAIRELSGLDHWISGASAAVMSRMADIHQHSDAALAKAEGKA